MRSAICLGFHIYILRLWYGKRYNINQFLSNISIRNNNTMAPCFLDTLFKSGWREIGRCHRCYNVPCQIQEPIFFFGTIRQIMRQLNIGHFILISQTNEGWYIWPENTSVFLSIYFFVCVRERKQMNVNCVCSVLILFIFFISIMKK